MDFGICALAVIPVRREPSDKVEMSTQLLFGDLVEILGSSGSWIFVRNYFDGYEGWIDLKQIRPLDAEEYHRFTESAFHVNRRNLLDYVRYKGETVYLPAGSSIYGSHDKPFRIRQEPVVFIGEKYPFAFTGITELIETAKTYLACPYLWGGKTCLGLDCSGFTQVVYKQHGIRLLRDAIQQSTQGEMINFISDSRPGDLAFFEHEDGRIIHVGILINPASIIHCSGKVRIDPIDHQGIYNQDLKKYTHGLRLIRRVAG